GALQFLGRRDGCVKTRGFRVELGEIEATLLRHPSVVGAAGVARPHPESTNVLFAFAVVEAASGIGRAQLVRWCADRLPPYMVPPEVFIEDPLPRTSTGKIARRELIDRLQAQPAGRVR